ncbi:geranylgeranyl reductase family protein [Stanieria sp. NIES-3757]|nr:geranylgeranyl reductase family protein [Stanieria sp. NIES-3757]
MLEYYETIIVGGGPAGSSCAWKLKKQGKEALIIDKEAFPRLKLCAGWISSRVMEMLEFTPDEYPHSMLTMHTQLYIAPIPFPVVSSWMLPWRKDYSIRRIEFDHWLLQRSQAPVKTHQVKKIERQGEHYIIDDKYECKYLVGAAGTGCPVRRTFFPDRRVSEKLIVTLEKEFEYPQRNNNTQIFFNDHGLQGYSWYAPKGNGFLNLGLGAVSSYFVQSKTNLHDHFRWFLKDLVKRRLLDEKTSQELKPAGHGFYIFTNQGEVKKDNCFLIGDSAGLATIDLAEGIRASVESGLLAADEILGNSQYTKTKIDKFSLNRVVRWLLRA